jgi:type I restriction enzyme S subunit
LLRHEVRTELAGKMDGTTGRQRLNQSVLENLVIPLPPLPEQRAIARVLHAVQAAREARQRELTSLDELFRALLEELMTGRVGVAGVL